METLRIGSLTASRVGLGCNNFGMRIDEPRAQAVVRAALDEGITFFDTADVYGGTRSEEFLGRALAGRRDEVVIATKFGSPLGGEGQRGAGARWVAAAVEGSLRRLGTDRIDLYQQHVPDPAVPIEETLGALDALVQAGKVREIGNSNFSSSQIDAAAEVSAAKGWARFVSAQNQFSLLERRPRHRVIPACERHGMVLLPYFPLASGLLTGKYRRGEPPPPGTRLALMPAERAAGVLSEANLDLVERLTAWAEGEGHTLLELAFAWLAAQPAIGPIIAGATSPE
ncbi:MAG TPA: aldo/keto reductase, partial [Acidimicrobiales bacterium]|nr:aldo/keto reductase [Acidimicrobiales bacterium]